MSNTPMFPADKPTMSQLAMPRDALCQCLDEVRQDLASTREKLCTADTADHLIEAVVAAHQSLVGHGDTLGEYVRLVRRWQTQPQV